jgi:septal ring factor EnvC (AmiA/AmiB activator)
MNKALILLVTLFFLLQVDHLQAQEEQKKPEKVDFDAERHKHQKRIAESMRLLETNEYEQKESLSKFTALRYQLEARKNYIENLQHEALMYEEQIKDRELEIAKKEKELAFMRNEYAAVIKAYAAKESVWSKMVLSLYFSSKTISELLSRKEYYEQYLRSRKVEINDIKWKTETLKKEQEKLLKIKAEKDAVLQEKLKQNEEFETVKNEHNQTLNKLKGKANILQKDIENSRKTLLEMDKFAQAVIKKNNNEIKRKEVEEFVKTENTKTNVATAKEVEKTNNLSEINAKNSVKSQKESEIGKKKSVLLAFEQTKSGLKWPVRNGFISGKFGIYQHPIYPKINLENHGVDIRTNENEKIVAVFSGEVVAVNVIQGLGTLVMLQHGEYFTVYGKLETAKVKVGEKIKEGDFIGLVGKNTDGYAELQFQIWKGLQRINPEEWLSDNQ